MAGIMYESMVSKRLIDTPTIDADPCALNVSVNDVFNIEIIHLKNRLSLGRLIYFLYRPMHNYARKAMRKYEEIDCVCNTIVHISFANRSIGLSRFGIDTLFR